MRRLVLRADADTAMGTGHFMRCLTLGAAWKKAGGEAVYLTRCRNAGLLRRAEAVGIGLVPVQAGSLSGEHREFAALLGMHSSVAVLDGYHFDETYQYAVKEAGHPLLVFDDFAHCAEYAADVVVNSGLMANDLDYRCAPYTRLLLGPAFALLRDEFLPWAAWQRAIPERARRVLVTLGGSDPDNVTLNVLQALKSLTQQDFKAVAVIGSSNPHGKTLENIAAAMGVKVDLRRDVTDIAALMAWADMAIAAGGTTCWELAFMGLPSLLLVLADNQRDNALSFDAAGVMKSLGDEFQSEAALAEAIEALMSGRAMRESMCEKGRRLVDGRGSSRLVQVLEEIGR